MNSNPQPLQGIGYVYVVRHANARGLTKIGLTRHPQKREEQLGGDDCEVLCRLLVLRPERVEAMLHSIFSAQRVPQSEWFDLGDEQIREACNLLTEAYGEVTEFCVHYKAPEVPCLRAELEPEEKPKGKPRPFRTERSKPTQTDNGFQPTAVGWLEEQRLRREAETKKREQAWNQELEARRAKGRLWE